MSMRTSDRIARAGLLCFALAACDKAPDPVGSQRSSGLVDCAVGAGAEWRRDCSIEQEGELLTFRHADGGFRRFNILKDGHGLAAADGAEKARLTIIGKGQVELGVGVDRYRIPATITAAGRQ